jgi:hypothetical protein
MMISFQPVPVAYGFIRCILGNMQIAASANQIHLKNKAIGIAAATLLNTYRGVKKRASHAHSSNKKRVWKDYWPHCAQTA